MKVSIDDKIIIVNPNDKNLVDVATRNKIGIPAPCYRAKQSKGCCHGCLVEINGKQKYACSTKPEDGMNIIINRDDLKNIRQENIKKYQEGIKSGNYCQCSSNSDCCQ